MPAGELRYPTPLNSSATKTPPDEEEVWAQIKTEARCDAKSEPALASYLYSTILSHSSLERSLAFHLGNKLCSSTLLSTLLYDLFLNTISSDSTLLAATVTDLRTARARDPACISFSHCLLNYKAAKIGKGILFDHATGVVIGDTVVIGNNVSILHHVMLGGIGKACGDRHSKIGDGVLIGVGATILGNVKIGEGAKIGAGSVVLIDVPPRTTAVGNPARLVGGKEKPARHEECPGESMDHTSFITDWVHRHRSLTTQGSDGSNARFNNKDINRSSNEQRLNSDNQDENELLLGEAQLENLDVDLIGLCEEGKVEEVIAYVGQGVPASYHVFGALLDSDVVEAT
ncbi:hypothetical protein Q3G72_016873 [Acer saccharum]|nr:hypothetical protein Q3G72_016873 [Acer saccharum]